MVGKLTPDDIVTGYDASLGNRSAGRRRLRAASLGCVFISPLTGFVRTWIDDQRFGHRARHELEGRRFAR